MLDEEDIERRADYLIRELDEFCALASNPKTADLINNQKPALGQMLTRVQLILSFLNTYPAPKFKMVKNG